MNVESKNHNGGIKTMFAKLIELVRGIVSFLSGMLFAIR